MSEENLYKICIGSGKLILGKGVTKVISLKEITPLVGRKIGEVIDGGLIGFKGYKFKITGGCDIAGIPMRFDVHGPVKKKILMGKGVGFKPKRKGMKKRKVIRGNEITDDMKLINMVAVEMGKTKLFEETAEGESKK
ncbi:MAG: S6e family ribosomal protein [Promethearchaeota archaeon]